LFVLTLKLDLVLDDQGLVLRINGLRELGGDGVVGGSVLHNKTLVALHTLVDDGLLNGPFTNVSPFLVIVRVFLGVRGLPSGLPVVGELLKERGLEGCGLSKNKTY
jgi:hypothetical protein